MSESKQPALLWQPLPDNHVECQLCNFRCQIAPGKMGRCQVRRNDGGHLYSLNYHHVCASHVDPIEKKPLFHFQPGRRSFSIAAGGCNFQCDFCQNWQISQMPRLEKRFLGSAALPEQIVQAAQAQRCTSIAYTYTEPTIFMELAADCGRLARSQGLANVFVSNGYMTREAIDLAGEFLDAMNVDLKAFTETFYRTACKASLQPVLDNLRYITHETDIWLEVTTLIVPNANDSMDEIGKIADFIAQELSPDVPWHISRYHPDFERQDSATPTATLQHAYERGKQAGLNYIYVGNCPGLGLESTRCPDCGQVVMERCGYSLGRFNVLMGKCSGCGAQIAGKDLDPVQF